MLNFCCFSGKVNSSSIVTVTGKKMVTNLCGDLGLDTSQKKRDFLGLMFDIRAALTCGIDLDKNNLKNCLHALFGVVVTIKQVESLLKICADEEDDPQLFSATNKVRYTYTPLMNLCIEYFGFSALFPNSEQVTKLTERNFVLRCDPKHILIQNCVIVSDVNIMSLISKVQNVAYFNSLLLKLVQFFVAKQEANTKNKKNHLNDQHNQKLQYSTDVTKKMNKEYNIWTDALQQYENEHANNLNESTNNFGNLDVVTNNLFNIDVVLLTKWCEEHKVFANDDLCQDVLDKLIVYSEQLSQLGHQVREVILDNIQKILSGLPDVEQKDQPFDIEHKIEEKEDLTLDQLIRTPPKLTNNVSNTRTRAMTSPVGSVHVYSVHQGNDEGIEDDFVVLSPPSNYQQLDDANISPLHLENIATNSSGADTLTLQQTNYSNYSMQPRVNVILESDVELSDEELSEK